MKKLGAYIGDRLYGGSTTEITILEQNTFVWYEIINRLTPGINGGIYEVSIWSLKGGYPNGRKPDAKFETTNPKLIENKVIPMKKVDDDYCIEWENDLWKINYCTVLYDYCRDYEYISILNVDQFGPNNYMHWEWGDDRVFSVLKNAKVSPIYKKTKLTAADMCNFSSLTMPDTVGDMIKEELKKSLEKSALNSCYGIGGFTTNPDPFKVVKIAEKETKTMEKKAMTETDSFLKSINGITITSTYSKLDFCNFGDPYYIYYPEMDITEDIADTLLTVLLMAKREYIHKVVFNPEKGTTTIYSNCNGPVTVRCKDAEFDYILGYNMARTKMWVGSDDYNWFNKIKNHRKTHIEYTEKKPTKKGGKK